MVFLELLFECFEAMLLLKDIGGIVPLSGGKSLCDDSVLVLNFFSTQGVAGSEESGFEGLDLVF